MTSVVVANQPSGLDKMIAPPATQSVMTGSDEVLALEITWDGQLFPLTAVELADHRRSGDFYLPNTLLELVGWEQDADTDWSADPAPQGSIRFARMTYFARPDNVIVQRVAERFGLPCPRWWGSVMVVGHHEGADVPLSPATATEVREMVKSLTVPAIELCCTDWDTFRLDPDTLRGNGMQVVGADLDGCSVQLWLEPGADGPASPDPDAHGVSIVARTVVTGLVGSGLLDRYRPVLITGQVGGDADDLAGVASAATRAATAAGLR